MQLESKDTITCTGDQFRFNLQAGLQVSILYTSLRQKGWAKEAPTVHYNLCGLSTDMRKKQHCCVISYSGNQNSVKK